MTAQNTNPPETEVGNVPVTEEITTPEEEITTDAPVEEVDMKAVAEKLASSMYMADTPLTGAAGFTAPAGVGIDPATYNQVRYPIPADSDCAHVYHAADYGISPDQEDNSDAIRNLLNQLRDVEGIKKLVFAEGVYRFSKTVSLSDLNDLYLCGSNDEATYTFLMTEWTPGITVDSCTNIHFNGLHFDYETPSAITGRVVSVDRRKCTVTLRVDDEYDLTHPNYNGGKVKYGSFIEYKQDEITGEYIPHYSGNLFYNSTGDGISRILSGTYNPDTHELTLGFDTIKAMKEGTRVNVAYTMYEYFGFRATNSQNVYLENVHLYHTAGMAMGATAVHNLYVNRVKITPPEGSERLMTATADCMHFYNCTGEVVISNGYISHSHDDALNIKGAYVKVDHSLPHEIVWDSSTGSLSVSAGDVLDVYEVATFRYLGSYTVAAVDKERHAYTVAERINGDLTGALICNASTSPSLTVENTFVGHKRNRGFLIQCREVTIRNCTFQNICHGAIQVLSVADIFAEGIMPRNVTIEKNKFINNNVTDVNIFTWGPNGTASGTIQDVHVLHNFFYGSGADSVHLLGAGKSSVENNFFCGGRSDSIRIATSEEITVTGNYTLRDKSGRKSAISYDEGDVRALLVTGNVTFNKDGAVDEPNREAEPLPEVPVTTIPFTPSLNALRAGFTYDWMPDGVDMDLTDSDFKRVEIASDALPEDLRSLMTVANGFSTHALLADGSGVYAFSGLSATVNRSYYQTGTVYYFTLPVATRSDVTVEFIALTDGGSRIISSFALKPGVQTVQAAYRVTEGDTGIAWKLTEDAAVCIGNLSLELSTGGPTLAMLKSAEGYTWDISATVFENSTATRVGDLTDQSAREALLAAGYSETDPVCIVKGGILQDFSKAAFFVPGTT
ncbi:MAG: right-handed parallel beta-helix repeat-containing protein, partial [Clostridia bacterium]|nr:right-handed parallel beta-helix repeat-containing protein [Clostridia bacterium]